MKLSTILGTACALSLLTTANLQADTLAYYPFTGSSLASTDSELNFATSAISLGSGLTDATYIALANGSPAPALRINTDETAATATGSILAGDDFLFTITPASGDKLVLDTLTFDLAVNSASITSAVAVQLSATGTTGTYTTIGSVTGFSNTTFTSESIDLTPANTALAAGLPVYVRFVVSDNLTNATAYTGFDNITVNGAVTAAIPEPGTNALLALGVLGVTVGGGLVRRRRSTV